MKRSLNPVESVFSDYRSEAGEPEKEAPQVIACTPQRPVSSHEEKLSSGWSFQRMFAILLLLMAVLCGYLAWPTEKIVASSEKTTRTRYITQNIEQIQPGQTVLAYDVRENRPVTGKVTGVSRLKSDHLRFLCVEDESGKRQTIQTTDTHPFWVVTNSPDKSRSAPESVSVYDLEAKSSILFTHDNLYVTDDGCYVEAGRLIPGDVFTDPSGNRSTLIKTWREDRPDGIDVFNFTVENNSNYFVIANYEAFQNGATPALAHNACGNFRFFNERELAKRLGINAKDIHPFKQAALSEAMKDPVIKKELQKLGRNPDIVIDGNKIGFRS